MISGVQSLSDLFSIFHDGEIADYASADGTLELQIRIGYLAQMVSPASQGFRIVLHGVRDIEFTTWPKDAAAAPVTLRALPDIFQPSLDILSGEVIDGRLVVICN